jgi:hypothetical protein
MMVFAFSALSRNPLSTYFLSLSNALESLSLSSEMRNNVISVTCMPGGEPDHKANYDAVTGLLFQ